jgi:hypothetical protein
MREVLVSCGEAYNMSLQLSPWVHLRLAGGPAPVVRFALLMRRRS